MFYLLSIQFRAIILVFRLFAKLLKLFIESLFVLKYILLLFHKKHPNQLSWFCYITISKFPSFYFIFSFTQKWTFYYILTFLGTTPPPTSTAYFYFFAYHFVTYPRFYLFPFNFLKAALSSFHDSSKFLLKYLPSSSRDHYIHFQKFASIKTKFTTCSFLSSFLSKICFIFFFFKAI